MGNYRFRLSDMIPNSWFYKLRDMSRPRNRLKTSNPTNKRHAPSSSSFSSPSSSLLPEPNHSSKFSNQPHLSDQRKSYYFTRDLTLHHPTSTSPIKSRFSDKELPRRSSTGRRSRRRSLKRHRQPPRHVSTTISAACSCRASLESVWATPEEYPNLPDRTSSPEHDSIVPECGSDRGHAADHTFDDEVVSCSSPCKCKAQNDIVIEIDDDDSRQLDGQPAELDRLPPIITNKREPTKIQRTSAEFSKSNAYGSLRVKVVKEDFVSGKEEHKTSASPVRRLAANSSSPGVRLRTNSPRILNRRIQGGRKSTSSWNLSRRSVSESFAVVKSSKDPWRDFRESMVEMIVENNIRGSKDLEELLACYLSLNSDEYHDLIINVFKQIWFDFMVDVRLK